MDSWLNMMLMCGLLLIASLQTTNSLRFRRSEKINSLETNIHHLQNYYKTHGTEWVAKSVFASYLDKLNSMASCTCQTLLLGRMLNIYEDMFKDMKEKSDTKDVQKSLENVMSKVEKLRLNYSTEFEVWRQLQNMNRTVKNETVQKGALNDFLMVFKRAEKQHGKDP
ncbi:hypothetical protein PO909_028931 [Leuciscus waleckii]